MTSDDLEAALSTLQAEYALVCRERDAMRAEAASQRERADGEASMVDQLLSRAEAAERRVCHECGCDAACRYPAA